MVELRRELGGAEELGELGAGDTGDELLVAEGLRVALSARIPPAYEGSDGATL